MRRAAAGLASAALLAAGPGLALSCLPPDPVDTFLYLDAAPETYVVVHGQVHMDAGAEPESPVVARIEGHALGRAGFVSPFDAPVTLVPHCISEWCGSLPEAGAEVLIFLRRDDQGYSAELDACGGSAFTDPSHADLERMRACMNGERCVPQG